MMGRNRVFKTPGRKLRQNADYQTEIKNVIEKIKTVLPIEGIIECRSKRDRFSNVKVLYCALNYIVAMNEKVKGNVDIDLKFLKNVSLQKIDIRDDYCSIVDMCLMRTSAMNDNKFTQTDDQENSEPENLEQEYSNATEETTNSAGSVWQPLQLGMISNIGISRLHLSFYWNESIA